MGMGMGMGNQDLKLNGMEVHFTVFISISFTESEHHAW